MPMVSTYYPNIQEAEAGGSPEVQGQPGLNSKTPCQRLKINKILKNQGRNRTEFGMLSEKKFGDAEISGGFVKRTA